MNIFSFGRNSLTKKDQNKQANSSNQNSQELIEQYTDKSLTESLEESIYVLISSNLTNAHIYLTHLNNKRSNLLILSKTVYDQMLSIFYGILTNIQMNLFFNENENDKKNIQFQEGIKQKCCAILDLIIILCQTFKKENDDQDKKKGELLLDQIKMHPIWNTTEVWKMVIVFSFERDFKTQKEMLANGKREKKLKDVLKEKEKNVMENVLITYKYHIRNFNVESNENEILGEFINKYKLHELNEINF